METYQVRTKIFTSWIDNNWIQDMQLNVYFFLDKCNIAVLNAFFKRITRIGIGARGF